MENQDQELLTIPTFVLEEQKNLGEALERLQNNSDYKLVFEEHIFNKHILGLTDLLSTSPNTFTTTVQHLHSISTLKKLLEQILRQGKEATKMIDSGETMIKPDTKNTQF